MKKASILGRVVVAALLLSFVAASVYAQTVSRVGFTIKDQNDEPLEGVTVTVSHPPTGLAIEKVTNKKGKATVALRDGSLNYEVSLSLDGYDPATTTVKPVTGSVSYQTYTLYKTSSGQAVPSSGGGEGGTREIPLTPAQEMFNEGVTALKTEDLASAEEKFLAALEMDPELHQTHSALAAIYLENKEFEKAKASAEVMIEKEPASARGYRMLYEAYSGLGNQEAADELLAKITELESESGAVPLIYNEGAEALRMGDMARARERLEKAHGMDPELNQAVKLLAIVYLNEKEFDKALEFAERYLVIDGEDLTMKKVRMDAYRGLGDTEKAEEAFQAVAEADPTTMISSLFKKGQEEFNAGDADAAVGTFQQILEIDPEHGMTHYLIGLAYVNKGANADAKRHFQRFVELMPDHENAATAKEMLSFL